MAQQVLRVTGLPDAPLDAAAAFHETWLPQAREVADDLVIVLAAADHTHRAWRLAVMQDLAREAAPRRVNAVAGNGKEAIAEAVAFLAEAPGITGQVLAVDGKTAKKG